MIASNCFSQADTNYIPTSKAVLRYYFEQTEKVPVLAADTLIKSKQILVLQNTIIQYQKDSVSCTEKQKLSNEKLAVKDLTIESKNSEIKTLGKKVSIFKFTTISAFVFALYSSHSNE